MKQGTVSVLFGCHSVIHSIIVVVSWKKLYGKWPLPWQIICIFIHDIGHWGKDYLDDFDQKKEHWREGARLAGKLFGDEGWVFCAGHCSHSGVTRSQLYKADKYSWHIAPIWWLWINNVIEPKLTVNCSGNMDAIRKFKAMVKDSVESGEFRSTHSMYLDRKRKAI